MDLIIGQLRINFIGDHNEVMLLHQLRNRQPVFISHYRTSRIVRIVDNKHLGARRYESCQFLSLQLELILRKCLNLYHFPAV
ncbi:hypothetical protein D3C78_992300 [compost metagenome]